MVREISTAVKMDGIRACNWCKAASVTCEPRDEGEGRVVHDFGSTYPAKAPILFCLRKIHGVETVMIEDGVILQNPLTLSKG
jgi:hypothetical protein